MAATGANNGANSNRSPGAVAYFAAADITRLSVNTSPVATRLNERAGGVSLTADEGADVISGFAATADAAANIVPAATRIVDHVNLGPHAVTP